MDALGSAVCKLAVPPGSPESSKRKVSRSDFSELSRVACGPRQRRCRPSGLSIYLGHGGSVLSDLSTRGAKHSRFLCDPLRLTVRNAALSIGHMCCLLSCVLFAGERACLETSCAADSASDSDSAATKFAVGFAKRDITPPPGLAMWGYGNRGDAPAARRRNSGPRESTVEPLGRPRIAP